MFGASGGRWFGSARRTCFDSCNVGPAVLAVGTGGKGRTEPDRVLDLLSEGGGRALPATTAAPIPAPTPLMIFIKRRLVMPFFLNLAPGFCIALQRGGFHICLSIAASLSAAELAATRRSCVIFGGCQVWLTMSSAGR